MISPGYKAALVQMHQDKTWGTDGWRALPAVKRLVADHGIKNMLDFGCGKGTLGKHLRLHDIAVKLFEYDPGVKGKDELPKRNFDLVVCTDVLEHVEPEHLDDVLQWLSTHTDKAAILNACCRPANEATLPDGRNAHLIVQPQSWWKIKIAAAFAGAKFEWTETYYNLEAVILK